MTAGSTATGSVVGAIPVKGSQEIILKCPSSGSGTYDISDIVIRTHDLG